MRVRSVLAFSTGVAVGAGAMYLLDPDHGAARRREARRSALTQARTQAVDLAGQLGQQARGVAAAAVSGYLEARQDDGAARLAG